MDNESTDFKVPLRNTETVESDETDSVKHAESVEEHYSVDDLVNHKQDNRDSDENNFGDDEGASFEIKCEIVDVKDNSCNQDISEDEDLKEDRNIDNNKHIPQNRSQVLNHKEKSPGKCMKTAKGQMAKSVRFHSAPPRIYNLSYQNKMDAGQYDRNKHKAFLRLLSLSLGRTVTNGK